ncbi:uncharacterized protein LOC128556052 [Mercenaria mercenaria]|uniref:uncharacterized protein LOC128556052 n=1 Tax=Mercenaria mercenaria TaxID=6596 RepID=UPI00234F4A44|nr:uncharacterized protein LOC128556052 [Mercenaria mercenaria]
MRLTVLILLVTISRCIGHREKNRGRYRYSKYHRPIYRPTYLPPPFTSTMMTPTTKAPPPIRPISRIDDTLSALIGVRIPPKECVISYDDFVEHAVDEDWITLYGIDNDLPINKDINFKWTARWDVINQTHIRRRGSYWNNLTGKCTFVEGQFNRIDDKKAIFGAVSGIVGTLDRRDYIVSFLPSKYVIVYVCFDASNINSDRCPNSVVVLLVKEQRTTPPDSDTGIVSGDICLDKMPWWLIEYTLKYCLGQQFVDDTEPQIMWYWENEGGPTVDCAKPGTEAFQREIENGK